VLGGSELANVRRAEVDLNRARDQRVEELLGHVVPTDRVLERERELVAGDRGEPGRTALVMVEAPGSEDPPVGVDVQSLHELEGVLAPAAALEGIGGEHRGRCGFGLRPTRAEQVARQVGTEIGAPDRRVLPVGHDVELAHEGGVGEQRIVDLALERQRDADLTGPPGDAMRSGPRHRRRSKTAARPPGRRGK
jgi:hypothetical protein